MKRIVLLNSENYPKKFNDLDEITPFIGKTKEKIVEEKLIKAINKHNPKLGIQKVEYLDISSQFPLKISSKRKNAVSIDGLIIEEFEIHISEKDRYSSDGCYVFDIGTKKMCRRILLYLFISPTDTKSSRNGFVAQTLFPILADYMEEYIDSPSYTIANHDFCFINVLNGFITQKSILLPLICFCAIGMDYIEVFKNSINLEDISMDIENLLKSYIKKIDMNKDVYDSQNYTINFKKKSFFWKTESMINNLEEKSGQYYFKGSNEKFYWSDVFPISILAYKQGYSVDYSEYEKFVLTYKNKFSQNSNKFERCKTLLKYIKKYFV